LDQFELIQEKNVDFFFSSILFVMLHLHYFLLPPPEPQQEQQEFATHPPRFTSTRTTCFLDWTKLSSSPARTLTPNIDRRSPDANPVNPPVVLSRAPTVARELPRAEEIVLGNSAPPTQWFLFRYVKSVLMVYVLMVYVLMAHVLMAHVLMAHVLMAHVLMAHVLMC
jgi:hypothetical protein